MAVTVGPPENGEWPSWAYAWAVALGLVGLVLGFGNYTGSYRLTFGLGTARASQFGWGSPLVGVVLGLRPRASLLAVILGAMFGGIALGTLGASMYWGLGSMLGSH